MKDYTATCYSNSFLSQVIFRIDFPAPVENDKLLNEEVDKRIVDLFPIRGMDQVKNYDSVEFIADQQTNKLTGKTTRFVGVERTYCDKNKNKVVLSNDAIILECNHYSTFEELQKWVHTLVYSIWNNGEMIAKRIGLRYINLFNDSLVKTKIKKSQFSSGVSKVMVPSLISLEDDSIKPIRSMVTTEYVFEDIKIVYRAGLYNQLYPMPITKDDFVIDVDCFMLNGIETTEDINSFMLKSHYAIQTIFEESITDKLREVML